ncbi:hypothetical protein [Spirosoma validum]|uniref:Uncharacterized protein n=1 Tax=Spirosoma validum TaxID=2771355 RepID=A0A927B7G3_9BACT|nr:hypothetical protein [Spirosoma validum]MBD2757129.1 hypothetical protein [Spirosoma validum]
MEKARNQALTRRKITIQTNIGKHIKSIELGRYHQSLESYLEGICSSFTIYKGNDATLWLKSYLSSFKGWGAIRYKENNVFPNGSALFKKYQEFGQRLWKDKKAQKILIDFLESGEGEYIDAINSLICKLKSLPNWEVIYEQTDELRIVKPLIEPEAQFSEKVETLPIANQLPNIEFNRSLPSVIRNKAEDDALKTFSDYMPEEYRENALPYLTERYTNAKPGMIWQMLISVTDLGIVTSKILNMTDNKLLSILESQFGKIGKNGRRSFNSAKNTYNSPGKKQATDIQLTKDKIKADLNINRL